MPGLLDLAAPVIEQLAKVRLDEPIKCVYMNRPKHYCFWVLREVGHRGLAAAAWQARHAVVDNHIVSAVQLGDTEWCRVMLEQNEYSAEEMGCALWVAASQGHTAVMSLLLQHGADLHYANDAPLYNAYMFDHTGAARFLLQRGADIRAHDLALLNIVVHAEDNLSGYHMTALFLEYGADPLVQPTADHPLAARFAGMNAIDVALHHGRHDIAALLCLHVHANKD